MRKAAIVRTLLVVLVLQVFGLSSRAQQAPSADEQKRVDRLVGLAQVWGEAKYLHPYLAYRDVDWDKALVEAIPKVNAAKTANEYAAAVNSMLAVLGDPETSAEVATENRLDVKPESATREFARIENGVLIIEAIPASKAYAKPGPDQAAVLKKTADLLAQAKSVIIDARSKSPTDSEALDPYLRSLLPQLLDKPIRLSTERYRTYSGYEPQIGTTSGGYYSGMASETPDVLAGNNKSKSLPVYVLVDSKPEITDILAGLQTAKAAFVIEETADYKPYGDYTHDVILPDGVRVTMRLADLLNADGSVGFEPDMKMAKVDDSELATRFSTEKPKSTRSANITPVFPTKLKDKTYPEMEFPNSEYRLLALFRFWNVINYFYPYKDLLDTQWASVLPKYITKFESAKDAADYQLAVREAATELQDSHVFVRGAAKADERLGAFLPPFVAKYIEKKTIVSYVLEGEQNVKVGDEIEAVDGQPIEKVYERYAKYTAASTPQALMRVLPLAAFRGQKDSVVRLKIRGEDGSEREVSVVRKYNRQDPLFGKYFDRERPLPVFTVLPSGFGYVDLQRLNVADVPKMFDAIMKTPATVFDMRGYPRGTAWSIAPRLTERSDVRAALFTRPIVDGRTPLFANWASGTGFMFYQNIPPRNGEEVYKGKVVMLINEDAISQAEHTAMFFEAATNVTFIGTPTTGANGDVTVLTLPGNLVVSFTGHNVRHADGRQLQRLGIQPNIRVAPTIKGFVAGKDEVLDAAITYLQGLALK